MSSETRSNAADTNDAAYRPCVSTYITSTRSHRSRQKLRCYIVSVPKTRDVTIGIVRMLVRYRVSGHKVPRAILDVTGGGRGAG